MLDRIFRRARPLNPDRWAHVVAVFTLAEREVARLDVAVGPCVPPAGRRRPLIGVTNQRPGRPEQLEALFRILRAKRGAHPWQAVETSGPGRLATFSQPFVEAMVSLNRECVARDDARPGDYDWSLEPLTRVAERWRAATDWDSGESIRVAGTLAGYCALARSAEERRQKLYCWSGPGFSPRVLVHGTAEELQAYLEAKRRR